MAESFISGHDGSVALPSGHGGKFLAWSARGSQARKDTTVYASGSRARTFRGGLTMVEFTARGLARQGAAGTAPGLTAMGVDGGTVTLTAMTGCTIGGTAVVDGAGIDHAIDNPAIDLNFSGVFSGTVTETWATS